MLSKLIVVRIPSNLKLLTRHIGGLTALEKYEKLRELCCTSEAAKRKAEHEQACRPRTPEVNEEVNEKEDKKPLLDIRSKNALILGGASSLGYETAHSLLAEGLGKVIIGDVKQKEGMDIVKKLCASFGNDRAFLMMTDLTQQPSIKMAFKEIYRCIGNLFIYINCVGIYNETPECWDQMVKTNLIGCIRGTLLALKYFAKNPEDENCQGPVIVNVSSYGSIANIPSMPIFSAASNGINGLTSSFGHDFHYCKNRVRFVTVCPACVDGDLLRNMERYHYDKQWAAHSNVAMKCCAKESPKVVGKAIKSAIKHGINGCVYVVKDGNYYRYAMPDYEKIMRQETILW